MSKRIFVTACLALIALHETAHGQALQGRQKTISDQDIESGWSFYRDKDGFSFRYPPSLTVRVDVVPMAHQSWQPDGIHWDREVSLVGDTPINPRSKVLVFRHVMVRTWLGRPFSASLAGRLVQLRKGCDTVNLLQMSKTTGFVCNTHGSAAHHWDVYTLAPYVLDISTALGGADSDDGNPPPHDGRFPLLLILRSVSVQLPQDKE